MGIFGGSGKSARLQIIAAEQQAALDRQRQSEADAQTQALMRQANEQSARAAEQASIENASIREQLDKYRAIAERPAPPPPPPAAVMVTGGTASDTEGGGEEEVKRRGRGALRIDMNAPQTGSNGSGLNVPRG